MACPQAYRFYFDPGQDGYGNNLLVVEDLRVTYGGVTAVDGVSLTVDEGEIVGLIGPSGAGKSSLIDALTGYHPAAGGRVTFAGAPLRGVRPYAIARRGLIRTFQSVELFGDLTVEENLLVAAEQPTAWSVLRDLVAPPPGADGRARRGPGQRREPGLRENLRLSAGPGRGHDEVLDLLPEPRKCLDRKAGLLSGSCERAARTRSTSAPRRSGWPAHRCARAGCPGTAPRSRVPAAPRPAPAAKAWR